MDKGGVKITYIKACQMLANILIKLMSGEKLYKFLKTLLNHLVPELEQRGCIEQKNMGHRTKILLSE